MNTKSSAVLRAFNEARTWQWIGCACLAVMIVETLWVANLQWALWVCSAR